MNNFDSDKKYPSLKINRDKQSPYSWIQWKGTNVCMDVYCKCGEHLHYDGDFAYHIKCLACKRVYECSGFIDLYEVDENIDAKELAPEDEY